AATRVRNRVARRGANGRGYCSPRPLAPALRPWNRAMSTTTPAVRSVPAEPYPQIESVIQALFAHLMDRNRGVVGCEVSPLFVHAPEDYRPQNGAPPGHVDVGHLFETAKARRRGGLLETWHIDLEPLLETASAHWPDGGMSFELVESRLDE